MRVGWLLDRRKKLSKCHISSESTTLKTLSLLLLWRTVCCRSFRTSLKYFIKNILIIVNYFKILCLTFKNIILKLLHIIHNKQDFEKMLIIIQSFKVFWFFSKFCCKIVLKFRISDSLGSLKTITNFISFENRSVNLSW